MEKTIKKETNFRYYTCSHCGKKHTSPNGFKKKYCPFCKHPYSMKPPIEYTLFCLQDKYLENKKNNKVSNVFFKKLYTYVTKLLLIKLKGKLSMNAFTVKEKVNYTVSKLFFYYQKPEFRIEGSFGGYINSMLLDTLYNHKRRREESHLSLDMKLDDEHHEIIDKLFEIGFSTLSEQVHDVEKIILENDVRIIEKLVIVIEEMFDLIAKRDSLESAIKFYLGLLYTINRVKEPFLDKYFYYFGSDINRYVQNTTGILYDVLKTALMD